MVMLDSSLPLTVIACGTHKGDPTGVLVRMLPPGRVNVRARVSLSDPPVCQYGNLRFYDIHFDKDDADGISARVQCNLQMLVAEQGTSGRKVVVWHCVNCEKGTISPFDIEFDRGLEKRGIDFLTVVTPIEGVSHADEMMVAARTWLRCPTMIDSLWEKTREMYDAIDYVTTESGHRLKRGGVVRCYLAGLFDHSGVYVGNGWIVHLANNNGGEIVKSGFHGFLDRMGGWNPAWSVDVACDHRGVPYGDDAVAACAEAYVGDTRDYSALFRNCHHFTGGCLDISKSFNLTDEDVLARIKSIVNGTFGFSWLEGVIREKYGAFRWCECEI